MIRKMIKLVLMVVLGFGLFYCAPARPVFAPPPPPQHEVRALKPGPNYVWVSGHYEWRHRDWVWINGYWTKHKPDHHWVEGHWVKRGRHWVWVPGHWKR